MPIDASSDDLDSLRDLVAQLSSERDAALAECKRVMEQNDRLRHLLQQLRRAQFGRKSERLDPEQLQLAIEDLETAVAAEDAEQDKTAPIEEAPKKKRKTNRGSLPAHLPRVHITLAPDSTACPCCHGVMHVIGEETAERLDKIPAQYQVIVTHRPKSGCRACEGAIVQALAQERLIKGGIPRPLSIPMRPAAAASIARHCLRAIPASFIATDTRSISSWPIRSATAVQRRWPFAGRTGVADLSRSTPGTDRA